MGFRFNNFKLDPAAEREGIWVDAGGGLRLLIARISSPDFEDWVRKHTRVGRTQRNIMQAITDSDEELETQVMAGAARYILLGWEDLVDDDDKPIIYSPEKAEELFTESREFYRMILQMASEYEGYRTQDMVAAAGNSPTPSNGG